MKSKKEAVIIVTHTETLCWAINWISERWIENLNRYRKMAATNPDDAHEFVEQDFYRQKLIALLQLYKIEVGKDFNMEFDLDL